MESIIYPAVGAAGAASLLCLCRGYVSAIDPKVGLAHTITCLAVSLIGVFFGGAAAGTACAGAMMATLLTFHDNRNVIVATRVAATLLFGAFGFLTTGL